MVVRKHAKPGVGGERYVPVEERTGPESVVFFTRDLSAEGLRKIYQRVSYVLEGKVAIKLHTGEKNGPNIIPRPWVKNLMEKELPDATIIETNTFYKGDRFTTEDHRETLKVNGWDFAPVDIIDEEGTTLLPVENGKWFTHMSVGSHLTNYDSMLTLTHFKGHTCGGFGGSDKNIGIGCADAKVGKKWIHQAEGSDNMWSIVEEEFMERMTESTMATLGHFGKKVCYINVLRNMSIDCDCFGVAAAPVVTPNVGIIASLDIVAIDSASVDMVYAMKDAEHRDLLERMESRHSHRQLSYMKEMGMGNNRYQLIDIDNDDAVISLQDAIAHIVPFSL